MEMLVVQDLVKKYPTFTLDHVSFTLEKGYIMGFIGRNGAGKTTTLKSMLNLVRPESGHVTVLGKDFATDEFACKQKIGFMFGGVDYYPRVRLREIASVMSRFYVDWDQPAFEGYLRRFGLDSAKRAFELSDGMKVKFALALALSHHAQLLVLDEPTSGLDPVSRDDLLELFQELIEDGEKSILFSTHITSDLEKCADFVTYIKDGRIIECTDKDELLASYRIVKGRGDQLSSTLSSRLIGCRSTPLGFTGLIRTSDLQAGPSTGAGVSSELDVSPASLESIMIHVERG